MILIIWIWCKVVVKTYMHQNWNLISMPCIFWTSLCTSKELFSTKSTTDTTMLVGNDVMHFQNCLFSHLATKLCLTSVITLATCNQWTHLMLLICKLRLAFSMPYQTFKSKSPPLCQKKVRPSSLFWAQW
jgi:hypothetical protein